MGCDEVDKVNSRQQVEVVEEKTSTSVVGSEDMVVLE